jgi:hypothetical protein
MTCSRVEASRDIEIGACRTATHLDVGLETLTRKSQLLV